MCSYTELPCYSSSHTSMSDAKSWSSKHLVFNFAIATAHGEHRRDVLIQVPTRQICDPSGCPHPATGETAASFELRRRLGQRNLTAWNVRLFVSCHGCSVSNKGKGMPPDFHGRRQERKRDRPGTFDHPPRSKKKEVITPSR